MNFLKIGLNQLLWYFADLEKQKCYILPGGLPDWDNTGDACMKWRRFGKYKQNWNIISNSFNKSILNDTVYSNHHNLYFGPVLVWLVLKHLNWKA